MSTTTPQMGLTIPQQNDPSPGYIQAIASSLAAIDAHDHSLGKGVQIPTAGINLNADLPFNAFSARSLRSAAFTSQSTQLNTVADGTSLYVYNGDLWYVTSAGVNVQLTQGAALAPPNLAAAGTINATNLTVTNAANITTLGVTGTTTMGLINNTTLTASVAAKSAAFNLTASKTITTYSSPRDYFIVTGTVGLSPSSNPPQLKIGPSSSALVYLRLPRVGTLVNNSVNFSYQMSASATTAPTAVLYQLTYSLTSPFAARATVGGTSTSMVATQTTAIAVYFATADNPYDRTIEYAILFTNADTTQSLLITHIGANTTIRTTDSLDAFA